MVGAGDCGVERAASVLVGFYVYKPMETQLKQTFQHNPKSALGSDYYRGKFEFQRAQEEAVLKAGVSPVINTRGIKDAHWRLLFLSHQAKDNVLMLEPKSVKLKIQ